MKASFIIFPARLTTLARPMTRKESILIWKNMNRKYLSKSKYTAFRQCPKILWMKIYKPEEEVIDPSLQSRLESRNEVGDLAMGLFGPFEEVTSFDADDKLDLGEMLRKTEDCLARGVENICEASFSWDGNYCACFRPPH